MTAEPRYVIVPQPSGEFHVHDRIAEHIVASYPPTEIYPGIPTAQQLAEHLVERLNHFDQLEQQRQAHVAFITDWLNTLGLSDLDNLKDSIEKCKETPTAWDVCRDFIGDIE